MRAAWWCIAGLAAVALSAVVWILFGRGRSPAAVLATELRAIDAGRRARTLEAAFGAERARAEVEEEHRDAVRALDARQKEQADALASDPVALARFLVRAGR